MRPPHEARKYKGFIVAKCQHCGKVKEFCAKIPIDTYFCSCEEKTPLGEMKAAYARCKCGQTWRYMTNLDDSALEVKCLECGSMIHMELDRERNVYDTPQERKYRGDIIVKCQQCGELKQFHANLPVGSYICDCGGTTLFGKMRQAYVHCKCGKVSKYMTNADDNMIEVTCSECGGPVDLEYNPRKKIYNTIQDRG